MVDSTWSSISWCDGVFRYDALLRQHESLQDDLRKRSRSFSTDSLDGSATAAVEELEHLRKENASLKRKLLQKEATAASSQPHRDAKEDYIDWKLKYEALQLENERLKGHAADSARPLGSDPELSEADLQSR